MFIYLNILNESFQSTRLVALALMMHFESHNRSWILFFPPLCVCPRTDVSKGTKLTYKRQHRKVMGAVVSRAASKCPEHQFTLLLFQGKTPIHMKQLSAGSVVLTLKYGREGVETRGEDERISHY